MDIEGIRQELSLLDKVAPLEGGHYANCLETYESASNQRALILRWLTDEVISGLFTEYTSILSIGCGAGDLDKEILSAAKKRSRRVTYVGIEPDSDQCERFRSHMRSENDQSTAVEVHNSRFESFADERRFDLVLMVHSLYYMDDPKQALEHALKLVGESGRLVVFIASDDTLNELASSFWARENGSPTWFSEDLSKHLETLDIDFECQRIDAQLDITACCSPLSEQGTRIADFVAQVPTGELPPRLRDMIFGYLEAIAQRDAELSWLPHNVDAFTIQTR